jgi:hypothetical protein
MNPVPRDWYIFHSQVETPKRFKRVTEPLTQGQADAIYNRAVEVDKVPKERLRKESYVRGSTAPKEIIER